MQINGQINKWEFNQNNQVVLDIAKILNIDIDEFEKNNWKKDINKQIKNILDISENKKNINLALYLVWEVDSKWFKEFDDSVKNNKYVALAWIKSSSYNFQYLNKILQKDIDIAKQILKTYIREWVDFFAIHDFILNNFNEKDSEILLNNYQIYLEKYSDLVWDDLSKTLIFLQKENPKLIKELQKNKIIINKSKKHIINSDFLKSFYYTLSKNKWYEELSTEAKNNLKKNELIKLLWLKELSETVECLLNLIIDLSFLEEDKIDSNKKIKDKNEEKNDKKKLDIEKNNDVDNIEKNNIFEDRMEYELPNYNFYSSWAYYNISTSENINIKISNTEKEQFTSEALENFIKFYKLLYKLWLNFLWDKYNSDFKSLLAFKAIDFDYTSWKGITDSTTLKILNLIWKNIWIPEHEVLVNDWESKTEIRCFKTLGDAKIAFESINASSKINDDFIETNINIWAVEKKLSMDEKINFAKWEINISKW